MKVEVLVPQFGVTLSHAMDVSLQVPLSTEMEFSRQEYSSGLACPPPGDFPNPGFEPRSPTMQANSLQSEAPRKAPEVQEALLTEWSGGPDDLQTAHSLDFTYCKGPGKCI